MRYIFVALLVVALACEKAEPPTEPAAPGDTGDTPAAVAEADAPPPTPKAPATPEPAPETAPVVTLVEAGKPPLQALRRTFKTGQKETMSLEVGETITMKGGGWDHAYFTLPMLQTIDIETKGVADGVAEVSLNVREAKELEGDRKTRITHQMNPTGVTGSYKVSARGIVTELNLDPPPDNRKVQKVFLDSMRGKVRWMAPPFPKEPVGVGAKWTVASEVNEFLTRMKEEVTVELVERTDSEIVLSFEVTGEGLKKHPNFKPPQEVAIDGQIRGRATIRQDQVVPRSSKLEQKVVQTQRPTSADKPSEPDTPDDADGAVVQTVTHTAEIRGRSPR